MKLFELISKENLIKTTGERKTTIVFKIKDRYLQNTKSNQVRNFKTLLNQQNKIQNAFSLNYYFN